MIGGIPLEIFRSILAHSEQHSNLTELLQLRLIDSDFEEEIITKLFTENQRLRLRVNGVENLLEPSKKHRLINGDVWNLAPRSLRLKYIRHRLNYQSEEPNLFVYLFQPVYERRLADLKISDDDEVGKNRVLDELLDLVACSKLAGSVIAHKSNRMPNMIEKTFPISNAGENIDKKAARDKLRKKQANFDYLFVKFALAVLNDETKALQAIENNIPLKRQSLCFGTSMFLFCLQRGSIDMVRRMIQLDPSLVPERKNPFVSFAAAAERPESARECVNLLLQHSDSLHDPPRRKKLLELLAKKAGEHGHLAIVQGILDWLEEHWLPNSCIFPLTNPHGRYLKREIAALWFNDPDCRHELLELVFAYIFNNRRTRERTSVKKADIFFKKPDMALLHLLLSNGVDVHGLKHVHRSASPPLLLAVQRGLPDWADALLQAGAGPIRYHHNILFEAESAGIFEEFKAALLKSGHEVVMGAPVNGRTYHSQSRWSYPHKIVWKR